MLGALTGDGQLPAAGRTQALAQHKGAGDAAALHAPLAQPRRLQHPLPVLPPHREVEVDLCTHCATP